MLVSRVLENKISLNHAVVSIGHTHTFTPNIFEKRRKDHFLLVPLTRTEFASRQYVKQSCYLYKHINKILDIYPTTRFECKNLITTWIKTLNYEETEALLLVKKHK